MAFPLCTQLYGWGQEYARQGKVLAEHLDEVLAAVREIGFDSAETSLDRARPGEVHNWASRLRAHGLRCISLYAGGPFHDPGPADAAIRQLLEFGRAMADEGFTALSLNPDPIGRPKTNAELAVQAQKLEELGVGLRELGVALGLHNHTPEMINGGREFHSNLRNTEPCAVGLFMDVHWCWRGGADPWAIYQEYADRIVGLHVRQSVDAIWTEDFGDGDLDYRPLFADLAARGFAGPVVVEIAIEEATVITRDVVENNRRSYEYLKRLTG